MRDWAKADGAPTKNGPLSALGEGAVGGPGPWEGAVYWGPGSQAKGSPAATPAVGREPQEQQHMHMDMYMGAGEGGRTSIIPSAEGRSVFRIVRG